MTPLLERVRAEQARYTATTAIAATRRTQRDTAIIEAIRAGTPYADIVEATGLTMGRISQLKRAAGNA